MKKRKRIICIYSIVILAFLVSCKQVIFDGSDAPLPTTPATKTPTAGAEDAPQQGTEKGQKTEQTATKAPELTENGNSDSTDLPIPTEEPVVTEAPTASLSPSASPTPIPTATPIPPSPTSGPITAAEAKTVLLNEIGAGYEAEHDGETKSASGIYYLFTVSDSAHIYTPQIAVDANSKEIFYFYSQDELVEFANFPPDNLESVGGEEAEDGKENGFTSQDAVALLNQLTPAELGLPVTLAEYTILVDEWTTMVYGLECYCVNAYAELENRKQLMGVYFVATDGSAAYRSDMGDFVLIY